MVGSLYVLVQQHVLYVFLLYAWSSSGVNGRCSTSGEIWLHPWSQHHIPKTCAFSSKKKII